MNYAVLIPSFSRNLSQQGVMLKDLVAPIASLVRQGGRVQFITLDGRTGVLSNDSYDLVYWMDSPSYKIGNAIYDLPFCFRSNFLKPLSISEFLNHGDTHHITGLYIPSTYQVKTTFSNTEQNALSTLLSWFIAKRLPVIVSGVGAAYLQGVDVDKLSFSNAIPTELPVRNLDFKSRLTSLFRSQKPSWQELVVSFNKKIVQSEIKESNPHITIYPEGEASLF